MATQLSAECPNACSSHGRCGAFDMCFCHQYWMGNDCSERKCQFGRAHVDSPKGDLDSSAGELSGPSKIVTTNSNFYPYGTTEQYPAMIDSNGNVLANTAHEYVECSNKGICDRNKGKCECFLGYEGSACQRTSCPRSTENGKYCSGHGVCQSIKNIARSDYGNLYNLWDEHSTMGCVCDPGYTGPDCSNRMCKAGVDPLYRDNYNTVRYSNFTYQIYTSRPKRTIVGYYSIIFYDYQGKDWHTERISVSASCLDVIDALETLPNNVIPRNTVRCYKNPWSSRSNGQPASILTDPTLPIYDIEMTIKVKFTIVFTGNPGYLKTPKINFYLSGEKPSLYSPEDVGAKEDSTVSASVYPNGFAGENNDYVTDYCKGVIVQLQTGVMYHTLTTQSDYATKLLKRCLGDSDGKNGNNVDVYNWDYGNLQSDLTLSVYNWYYTNPHLIKLVDTTLDSTLTPTPIATTAPDNIIRKTKLCTRDIFNGTKLLADGICDNPNPPGFYAVIFYDGTNFNILNPVANDYDPLTNFHVFTTTGYLQLVSPAAEAQTISHFNYSNDDIRIKSYFSDTIFLTPSHAANVIYPLTQYKGELACDSLIVGKFYSLDCLKKDDLIMLLTTNIVAYPTNLVSKNPIYPNIYTVKRIFKDEYTTLKVPGVLRTLYEEMDVHKVVLDRGVNGVFYADENEFLSGVGGAAVYKFYPPSIKNNYVNECANRGLCDAKEGVCDCFTGFTSDDCSIRNALAK